MKATNVSAKKEACECILTGCVHFGWCTSLDKKTKDKRNWLVALSILRLLAKNTKGQSNWCITLHAMRPLVNVMQNI